MKTNIFFTSDWHIGHENCIKFDNRPFTDIEHMHRVLINNYNSSVKPNDICYFLGDIGLTKGETVKSVITALNGTKICILGNHDKGVQSMLASGFSAVMHNATIYIGKTRVSMSHCPLPGIVRENTTDMKGAQVGENWHGEYRHKMFVVPDEGQFHLHGHIHSPNGGKSEKVLGKQYDVGVVANGYRPVSISQIESWIANYGKEKI